MSPDRDALPTAPDDELDARSTALDEAVGLAFRVLKGLMLVLVVLFAFSGFFSVQPNEVAFVSWLGQLGEHPRESGGHLTAPLISRVVRVDLRSRESTHEAFDVIRSAEELVDGRLHARQGGLDPKHDGYLVTGDANLIHVALSSRVKVARPRQALTGARDPEALVDVLVERAAVRAAARSTIDRLLGAGKADFSAEIGRDLQASLLDQEVGFDVEVVEFERPFTPPAQAQDAFVAVSEAVQAGDQAQAQARSRAAQLVSDAQSQAARTLSGARSDAQRIRVDAEADRQVFLSLRDDWSRDPAGLRQRLLVDALVESLDNVDEVFLVTDGELRLRIQRDAKARVSNLAKQAKEFTRREY